VEKNLSNSENFSENKNLKIGENAEKFLRKIWKFARKKILKIGENCGKIIFKFVKKILQKNFEKKSGGKNLQNFGNIFLKKNRKK